MIPDPELASKGAGRTREFSWKGLSRGKKRVSTDAEPESNSELERVSAPDAVFKRSDAE